MKRTRCSLCHLLYVWAQLSLTLEPLLQKLSADDKWLQAYNADALENILAPQNNLAQNRSVDM